MFEKLFLQLLNMSFTAGVVILFVLTLRLLLKKAPRIYSYALWSVVLFRLLCPFSFESALSLLPTKANPISPDIGTMAIPEVDTGIVAMNQFINTSLHTSIPAAIPEASINSMQIWVGMGAWIWLIGALCLLSYSMIALLRLRTRLKGARHLRDNRYVSDRIDTAFVMGIFRPKIYLPANLSEKEKEYILRHEETHIERFDHIIKVLAFLALCLHWFNPLVWLAFFLSTKDMEMSCDEAVIKKLGDEVKKDYSASLLTLATGQRMVGGTPLAFGEGDTKSRVRNVLNYKKPAFWVIAVSAILVIGLVVGLMANPLQKSPAPERTSDIEALWQARTNYVGDNSAVSHMVGALAFPEKLTRNGIKLETDTPPYGVIILFKTDAATQDFFTDATEETPFKESALILFSLIENADQIEFVLEDGEDTHSFVYTRTWAQLFMGEEGLFAKTETLEGFEGLMKEIATAMGRVTEYPGNAPLTFFVKPDEPPEVIADAALAIWQRSGHYNPIPPAMPAGNYEIIGTEAVAAQFIEEKRPTYVEYPYITVRVNYALASKTNEDSAQEGDDSRQGSPIAFSRILHVKGLEHGSFEIVKIETQIPE